jgi:hypothetical protein
MSIFEGKDLAKTSDLAAAIARKQYAYWLTANKQKVAERLCRFLKICKKFNRTELRGFLFRERYGTYPYPRESAFVKKALDVVLTELMRRLCCVNW